MQTLFDPQIWLTLAILTGLEMILGIDNLVVLTLISQELPKHQQGFARRVGLLLAVVTRLLLLGLAFWLVGLVKPLFWMGTFGVSANGLILFFGGLFLIYSGIKQFFQNFQVSPSPKKNAPRKLELVIFKILLMDIVFSIDTVITAVGIAQVYWVMALAIILAILAMIWGSDFLSACIEVFPRIKTIALVFLVVLGAMLILEALHLNLHRSYLYVAMGFALLIELLNIFSEKKGIKK